MEYSNVINQEFDSLVEYWGKEYASYYAGAYISNNHFTIMVTCNPKDVQNDIWNVTNDKNISIIRA